MKIHEEGGGVSTLEAPTETRNREPAAGTPKDEELVRLLERAFRYVGPPIIRPEEKRTLRRIRMRLGRRMAYRILTGRDPGPRPPRIL